jgi:plastocyanin
VQHVGFRRIALACLSLAAIHCSGNVETGETGPGEQGRPPIQVRASDTAFTPDRINAAPGETVRIQLVNEGLAPHSIVFDFPGTRAALGNVVEPGGTGEMKFAAPARPGTYEFFSPLQGDRDRGLVGTLVVQPPGMIKPLPGHSMINP